MQTWHNVLKWVVAVISATVGGFIGIFAGPAGAVTGVVSGLLVGYYYIHFTLKLESRYALVRILRGTFNGALAGLICGASVHIPNLSVQGREADIFVGAAFGIALGIVFGFIVACIIAFMPREKESEGGIGAS